MTDYSQLVKGLRQLARDMVKLDMDMSLPAGSANPEDAADAIDALQARVAELEAGLRRSEAAASEYYRYWTGGEMRGSYDGKPERSELWASMWAARALLERKLP